MVMPSPDRMQDEGRQTKPAWQRRQKDFTPNVLTEKGECRVKKIFLFPQSNATEKLCIPAESIDIRGAVS